MARTRLRRAGHARRFNQRAVPLALLPRHRESRPPRVACASCQAGFRNAHVGIVGQALAQNAGNSNAHAVVGEDRVAQAKDQGSHVRMLRDKYCMTSPCASRMRTSSGICPGSVWVAQPRQGSSSIALQKAGDLSIAKDRPVGADVLFAKVAAATLPDPALHLGLQGDYHLLGSKS